MHRFIFDNLAKLTCLSSETWAWDVRTKHVTSEPIPTIENVRGIANYGPTATLFTLGPNYSIQQYDLENPAMVANVQHLPVGMLSDPLEEARARAASSRTLQDPPDIRESGNAFGTRRAPFEPQRADTSSPVSSRSHAKSVSSTASSGKYRPGPFSPPSRSAHTGTSFSLASASERDTPQPSAGSYAYAPSVSSSSVKSSRAGSRLRNEVQFSPADKPVDLFPFTRARLNDVPFRNHPPLDESRLTPDDLRRQMLSVVFGWEGDIDGLITDECKLPFCVTEVLIDRPYSEPPRPGFSKRYPTSPVVGRIRLGPDGLHDKFEYQFDRRLDVVGFQPDERSFPSQQGRGSIRSKVTESGRRTYGGHYLALSGG